MPHGDPSDYAALCCFASGLTAMVYPHALWASIGPISPMLVEQETPEVKIVVGLVGALLMYLATTLFVVRWNTLNGKAAALGTIVVASTCVRAGIQRGDGSFLLTGWWILAAVFLGATIHLIFNANELWTSKTLAAHEKERAAKKAAKKAA